MPMRVLDKCDQGVIQVTVHVNQCMRILEHTDLSVHINNGNRTEWSPVQSLII